MISEKHIMFKNRLAKVYKHLGKLARRQNISCFRLYDRDLPEFPLIIELYGTRVYIAEYRSKHSLTEEEYEAWLVGCVEVIKEVLELSDEQVFIKLRQRKEGRHGQYQKLDEKGEKFTVQESGLYFRVNLTDYLDTGLFLDHRVTRQRVRENCEGKKVLNLFCYTGSFSVYAAAGGASEVVSVDLSNTYLAWMEENMMLNGFDDPKKYKTVRADVKQYLETLPSQYFDLVVMDPPTFSNSKMMKDILDIQRDHVDLLNEVIRATKPGGQIYFSNNYRKFELNKEALHATEIKDITKATTPFDFEGKLLRWCYLITV
ncbi:MULTISPECIES: class I SAM-dependent methyltransferase [unclassified Paraflavitalea]|uniref:class I SAM-dependent methyltransferase n=1 Tax=unclassified Paraflavitalea TaxID=2798305 RepID=UPI003D349449